MSAWDVDILSWGWFCRRQKRTWTVSLEPGMCLCSAAGVDVCSFTDISLIPYRQKEYYVVLWRGKGLWSACTCVCTWNWLQQGVCAFWWTAVLYLTCTPCLWTDQVLGLYQSTSLILSPKKGQTAGSSSELCSKEQWGLVLMKSQPPKNTDFKNSHGNATGYWRMTCLKGFGNKDEYWH